MTKQQAISLKILALVSSGVPVRKAIDEVLGAGVSQSAIESIWLAAQAK